MSYLHKSQQDPTITTVVILAAGRRSDFDLPVAFLKIDGEITLIDRTISILLENDIENIIIVTGYKNDHFSNLTTKHPQIQIVQNENYQHTGTMKSLSLTKSLITSNFLLLESDIIFEVKAIKKLLANPEPDCMIITNESGSGDEALVEIRNNYIYNMSKDKHQLNKIDGEMIGISKISYKTFNKMLNRFKENRNPYLNYEYMLMDIKENIGFEKLGDLVWWEFDTKHHYSIFKKDLYRRLYHQEKEWYDKEVKKTIGTALDLNIDEITDLDYVGGMTNTNYKVTIAGKNYIVRIPGRGTEGMINRVHEKTNCTIANQLGLDAKVIYIDAESGVKVAEFMAGVDTLSMAMTKREDIMTEVVKLFRTLHHAEIRFKNDFDVFSEI